MVLPTGASVGEAVRVSVGGPPGLGAGDTVTLSRPWAPPPRPSATEASYGTVAVRASDGAVKETELPEGSGKRVLTIHPKSQAEPVLDADFVQAIRSVSPSRSVAFA